ncbi:MAG TPA: hypothetical protein VGB17_00190 [Pyrinomonadaceae bacterium]|jgi:hypothetical protein
MNNFFRIAMLLLLLAPQNQRPPRAFYQIPEEVRERATVIVSGTYAEGRTPCIFMPDGSREWLVDSWFEIKRVYRGHVGSKSIRINKAMLPATPYVSQSLEREHHYLVLLRPSSESMTAIETEEGIKFWDALHDEEIIAIVKLK